jgi:Flp pilus assembly protein TadG
MPVFIGMMALAIDVSYWEMEKNRLQHIADLAALAGSSRYAQTASVSSATATAATVAELNGVPAGTRTTTGSALTDNYGDWTTSYSFDTSTATLTATVQTSAPVWFGRLYTTATKQMISATAAARTTQQLGGKPCVLALKGNTTGVTTYVDLSIGGSTSVTSSTCGLRSDGGLDVGGSATLSVPGIVASGSVTGITCSPPSCNSGAPQIPDPLGGTYGETLSVAAGGQTQSGTTLSPGTYASGLAFNGNANYTLNPGVYYVNGAISMSGTGTVIGNGVTLISTNGISMTGNGKVTLTAPSTGSTAGLLYGTSSATASVSLLGNSANTLNGAVYAPNTNVKVSGDSKSGSSSPTTCSAIVGSTVTFTGNSTYTNSGCDALGVPPLYTSPKLTQLVL